MRAGLNQGSLHWFRRVSSGVWKPGAHYYTTGGTMDALFEVLVKIGEETLSLEKCEWVWYLKCGCPFACAHAETASEEAAWKDMFYYATERNKHRRNGVTAELMSFEKAKEEVLPKMMSGYTCPHVKE